MFALKTKVKSSNRRGFSDPARSNNFVLPRLLRRPARFAIRLCRGDVVIPRYFEASLNAGVVGAAILYGSMMGGQLGSAVNTVSAHVGFSVQEIEISGNNHTDVRDIYAALELDSRRSLISIDADQARNALVRLPWIETARISKVYPNRLDIDIEERSAFALWQQGEAVTVVEEDGTVIGGYAADSGLAALPLLVGKQADSVGKQIIDEVAQFTDVAGRVRAYIRVGTRRWNLRLDNGMTIRLPEHDVQNALGRLTALQAELGVFERDLAAIDLRMKDRTVFALTENARTTREAFVKARRDAAQKIRKERGSRI